MREDHLSLAYILGSFDETTFLRDYWTRKLLLLQDGERNRFDGLFGLSELESYLFIARPLVSEPQPGDVQLVRQGNEPPIDMVKGLFARQSYDVQSLYDALNAGYTIVLNAIHERWPAVHRLLTELEDRLLAKAKANAYFTAPNAQGFSRHCDDHDVLVLQTYGAKRWQVYEKAADASAGGEPKLLHDIELRRGDVIYIPQGFPHAAATSNDFSIHITIALLPLRWHDLARQVLNKLAQQDPSWTEVVPLPGLGGDEIPTVAQMEARLRQGLSKLQDLSEILETYRTGLSAAARRKNPAPGGYLESITALENLGVDAEVERRPGVGCSVTSDSNSASIRFMSETIRAPAKAAKALEFIAANRRFCISQLDDELQDESKLVLVRRLIRKGLLRLPRLT